MAAAGGERDKPVHAGYAGLESRVDASHKTTALSAINDRLVPVDENDRSMAYYHWWPKKNDGVDYFTSSRNRPKCLPPPCIGSTTSRGRLPRASRLETVLQGRTGRMDTGVGFG